MSTIHIVVPEGLNRPGSPQALSCYYEACVRAVASAAAAGDIVYMAPGNAFGSDKPEDYVAAEQLQALHPGLRVHTLEVRRDRYLDTFDNATLLREWADSEGRWPLRNCRIYCGRYHRLRSWLCFWAAGYRPDRVVTSMPEGRNRLITNRLKYYDYPALHVVYEALAVMYTLIRIVSRALRLRLRPAVPHEQQ